MTKLVPQRTYSVFVDGPVDPGAPADKIQSQLAAALRWQPRAMQLAWAKLPCRVAKGLTAKEARVLESTLQRAGARVRTQADDADRPSLADSAAVSMRPSEVAAASRAQPQAGSSTRIMAYLAAGFAVLTLLLLMR